jgi:hypothetical protein
MELYGAETLASNPSKATPEKPVTSREILFMIFFMKTLELNNYSCAELKLSEQQKVEGGWYWLIPLTLAVLNTDWDKAGNDFKKGFES